MENATDLRQIWWKHGYGIVALSNHLKKTSWPNDVATLLGHNVNFDGFLATVAVFFDRFASNLVETWVWHSRIIESLEKNVMT